MTPTPSFRDVEQLSAYLDNHLSQADRQRLETRLKTEPELRGLLSDLSQSRSLLRSLPARKAPRNFRLTPEMAGIRPPIPRAFPMFRLASTLAAVLFFFAFASNLLFPFLNAFQSAATAPPMVAAAVSQNSAALPPAAPMIEAAPTLSSQANAPGSAVGGGPISSDTAAPQATEPVVAAPMAAATSELTATPSLRMMAPLATQTPELSAPNPTVELPAPTRAAALIAPTSEAPAATEAQLGPAAMAKNPASDLNQPQTVAPQPEPIRPPVPAWLQLGLLGLAVVSGGAAYLLRVGSERVWFKAHSLPSAITVRQIILLILLLLLVLAFVIGIIQFSSMPIYAP